LVERIRTVFRNFPDQRRGGNNQRYEMEDAALSAFSVFFLQSPSFLDYQIRMQQAKGKNNAQSLFGVHQIPTDVQTRNLLDPVPSETIFPLVADLGKELFEGGHLDSFRAVGDTLLIALDGTEFFSSEKIACSCCSRQTLSNGKTRYRHSAVTPVIVAPGQAQVIPLPPQFVTPQDGQEKQDCELAAASRWLTEWTDYYGGWRVTLLGDDLYCHQPFCQRALDAGFAFLFTCKPDSHAALYEWVADLDRQGLVQTLTVERKSGKRRFIDAYRYVNDVPLRDTDNALMVNWCELTTTTPEGKMIYHNAWATSHPINNANVEAIAASGRARWKIENENNNTLKTKGYHFEHNYGHGKKHLANLLATMILMAYLVHTILDWMDDRYHQIRRLLPSRRTFFEHLRALLLYLPFDNWDHLMSFMLDGLGTKPPNTG
jgi:hypothetical protein